jgi:hypothetical protein
MNKFLQALFNQFVKQYGRKPNNLETILLKQKAMNEALDKRKVISMVDRQPVDPNRPIMGGTQEVTEDTGKGFIDFVRKTDPEGAAKLQKTENEIRAAIEAGNKRAAENLRKKKGKKLDDPEEKAYGGRIGLKEGEGIMQMASDPDPMDERNNALENLSDSYFGKPLKDLTPKQIEFLEEALEEMSKKPTAPRMMASAPDPMDERNTVMENIAMDEFGKPLKDLSEEEIIQIEEMMDEMSIKKDRGAPSIKLAAEGGIMRVGLKEGLLAKINKPFKIDRGTLRSMFFNKNNPIITGFNSSELFDLVTNLSNLPGLAEGGRIGYKDGPKDPTKRKFMKAAVGIASVLPFGIGKGVKMAAPVVTKAAEITGPALAKIVETVMNLGKLISVKGRRVKEMVTKKKHEGVEVTEDISDGSYIIKKGDKEIYYKPGRQDETGGFDDDIIEILEDRIKKAGGGLSYMLGE